MKAESAEKQVGQVVGIDLLNGQVVVTRIEKVENGFLYGRNLMVFQAHVGPRDPSKPPDPRSNPMDVKVSNAPYGAPLFDVIKSGNQVEIDLNHILWLMKVPPEMATAYVQSTSGIMPANAGTLDQIDRAVEQAKKTGANKIII